MYRLSPVPPIFLQIGQNLPPTLLWLWSFPLLWDPPKRQPLDSLVVLPEQRREKRSLSAVRLPRRLQEPEKPVWSHLPPPGVIRPALCGVSPVPAGYSPSPHERPAVLFLPWAPEFLYPSSVNFHQ